MKSEEIYNTEIFKKVVYAEMTNIKEAVDKMLNELTDRGNDIAYGLEAYRQMIEKHKAMLDDYINEISGYANEHVDVMRSLKRKLDDKTTEIENLMKALQSMIDEKINSVREMNINIQKQVASEINAVRATQEQVKATQEDLNKMMKKLEYGLYGVGGVLALVVVLLVYVLK